MSEMAALPNEITPYRMSVDEFYRIGDLLDEDRTELLDGVIVAVSPVSVAHGARAAAITIALGNAFGSRAVVIAGGSMTVDRYDAPLPDVSVLRPLLPDAGTYASVEQALCVVEVAKSSLTRDLHYKAHLSARAGVADYLVADIDGDVVHHHTGPSPGGYASVAVLRHGATFSIAAFPDIVLRADAFLAPR
ncbi:hypothetical protein WPS_05190 [Vulcanimicrobium alpinum]|uniref:Putative restriction endonuclease domain-containing protein n=1 Tax=Vulcanimicrobium alpinum TaxID=3016050 RepID=A0AAN1XW01_UNVUL|nr:Uma2 family endonuclease [Vulcanimicrobium alpinum]BDE05243.1 hypothetical protein WPS_05190 [Vulcanimicrobium alpinum]